MPEHKGVLVIFDGLGDRPSDLFDGRTPLEAAETPVLDRLAAGGQCGQVDPLGPGIPVGTQIGAGILLGLPPRDTGRLARGPVEAAGVGLHVQPGDVAFRCNFATVRPEGERLVIVDRRAGRIARGTDELAAALAGIDLGDGISATLHPATQHRAVLRLSGSGLSAAVTDTDPGDRPEFGPILECLASKADLSSAHRTAAVVNRFVREAHARLVAHPVNERRIEHGLPPANAVITRGAGEVRALRSVITRFGLRVGVVAAECTILGLGELFQYTVARDPRFTALPDTDVTAKIERTLALLEDHDLVVLHLKGTDICAHDRDPAGKKAFLERVDPELAELARRELVVGVSADHSTDSKTGRHTGDPVPSLLSVPGGRRDRCDRYGETACMTGGLGRISAGSFLLSMLDGMGCLGNARTADLELFGP